MDDSVVYTTKKSTNDMGTHPMTHSEKLYGQKGNMVEIISNGMPDNF